MNRVIRFRAWDKEWKMMHFNIETYDWNQPVFKDRTEFSGLGEFIVNKKRFIIQQYTGLKDKRGIEIYEEDIVKDKDGLLFVVGWGEDTAQFSTYPLDKDNDDHRERFNGEQSDDFEIIGNIYKNKDLIK